MKTSGSLLATVASTLSLAVKVVYGAEFCVCDSLDYGATTNSFIGTVTIPDAPGGCPAACLVTPTCNNFYLPIGSDTCFLYAVSGYFYFFANVQNFLTRGLSGNCDSYTGLPVEANCRTVNVLLPSTTFTRRRRDTTPGERRERRALKAANKCDMC